MSNIKTVWFTFKDSRRDYSAADRFGESIVVFSNPGRNYNGNAAIDHARRAMANMREDDYIVPSGDPVLSVIVAAVAIERFGRANLLRWDNRTFKYDVVSVDFDRVPQVAGQ